MNKHRKFTLDNDTYASNPGGIKFNPFVWFLHRKVNVSILVFLLLISILVSVVVSYLFFLFSVLMITINAFYWVRAKEHFTADSNPGIIISESPALYAVYTDLTKGVKGYPVIKVMSYSSNSAVTVNQKIATIATYSDTNGKSSPYWSDFSPLPVEYATSDQASILRELESYDAQSWHKLDDGLAQLPNQLGVGIYRLQTTGSKWKASA